MEWTGPPQWWNHFHFPGLLPWLGVVLAPFILFAERISKEQRTLVKATLVAWFLSLVFTLSLGSFTLYEWIFRLPGFSVLRAMDRFINVQVIFFLLVFIAACRPFFRNPRMALVLALALPVLTVWDNRWEVGWMKRFDKRDTQQMVDDVARRLQREYGGPAQWDAVAYEPIRPVQTDPEDFHSTTITIQITTMLAAQELAIPVVNAYTGGYPGNYISFFDHLDHRTLAGWCAYNGMRVDRVQEVNGLQVEVVKVDTVTFLAPNGRYLSVKLDGEVVADRANAADREAFVRVQVEDQRFAFLTHTGNFLTIGPGAGVMASHAEIDETTLFRVELSDNGGVYLQVSTGEYMNWAPSSGAIQLLPVGQKGEAFQLLRFR